MTKEELAKDYVQTECCNSCTDSCKKNKCKMYCNVRNAVLYGLAKGIEEGRPQWHKVADGDLPNDYRYVWTNVGASYYDTSEHCWRDEFSRTQGVIAWCEPKFEE